MQIIFLCVDPTDVFFDFRAYKTLFGFRKKELWSWLTPVVSIFAILLPNLVTSVTCVGILIYLRRKLNKAVNFRGATTVLLIALMYFISYIPIGVYYCYEVSLTPDKMFGFFYVEFFKFAAQTLFINCSYNFFIYFYSIKSFRAFVLEFYCNKRKQGCYLASSQGPSRLFVLNKFHGKLSNKGVMESPGGCRRGSPAAVGTPGMGWRGIDSPGVGRRGIPSPGMERRLGGGGSIRVPPNTLSPGTSPNIERKLVPIKPSPIKGRKEAPGITPNPVEVERYPVTETLGMENGPNPIPIPTSGPRSTPGPGVIGTRRIPTPLTPPACSPSLSNNQSAQIVIRPAPPPNRHNSVPKPSETPSCPITRSNSTPFTMRAKSPVFKRIMNDG
eukprot:sb/3479726/